jgi:3-oxoadipate enol-lactonase
LTPATAHLSAVTVTDAVVTDRHFSCNGITMRYRDEGSGPAVVLVHGWTLDLEMWVPQTAALHDSFRVICYDRRGFGLTSGHPSIEGDLQDLEALCHHLELGRVALVGMSQGARAVMKFATTAPERISCVVLDGPPDLVGPDATDLEALKEFSPMARSGEVDAFRREWLNHPLLRLRTRDPSAHQALRSMIERYPGKDLVGGDVSESGLGLPPLESFEVPTLLVTGEYDLTERIGSANALARRLPRAERATIPDSVHLPNLDNPGPYNAVLRAFLSRNTTTAR